MARFCFPAVGWLFVTDLEIRPLGPDDDLDAQLDLSQQAFGVVPAAEREDWKQRAAAKVGAGQFLGAFAGGSPAGAAYFHDMRQWWHGRPVPMAGVAGVKVAPEHRGRGVGRRLMTELLDQIADRGYPLSALYPATMRIYRSLGWEVAGSRYRITVPTRELRTLVEPDPAAGGPPGTATGLKPAVNAVDIRRATPDDALKVIDVLGRAHESARHSGPLTRDAATVRRWLADDHLYAYLAPDGFLAYSWNGEGEMLADRIVAASPVTYRALWSVLAGQSSTASVIRAKLAPGDPLRWLTREGDVQADHQWMWMLRVVDAPAAIAARGYPPSVSLSVPLVIADGTRPSNDGRWRLVVDGGQGALTPDEPAGLSTGAGAPLTLGARGLAALYGGTPLAALRQAGLVSGGSPDTDSALDAAFPGPSFTLDEF